MSCTYLRYAHSPVRGDAKFNFCLSVRLCFNPQAVLTHFKDSGDPYILFA